MGKNISYSMNSLENWTFKISKYSIKSLPQNMVLFLLSKNKILFSKNWGYALCPTVAADGYQGLEGQWAGSVDNAFAGAWQPDFYPWDPCKGRREQTPRSDPLTPSH